MIGEGYAELRDLPLGEPGSGSFGASDLEVDPCQRYDLEGRVATNFRRRPQQISR
jgi:hypothetical protein